MNDHINFWPQQVRVSLRAEEILNRLFAMVKVNKELGNENVCLWTPEYAGYMVEGTPGMPYGGCSFTILTYIVRHF